MGISFYRIILFIFSLFLSLTVQSAPLTEKSPSSSLAPISALSSQPDKIFLLPFGDFQDQYLFAIDSTSVTIVDTTTFAEHSTQPEAFLSTVTGATLLENGTSIIFSLSDGNLARIELDDEDTFSNTDNDETDEDEEDDDGTDSRQIDSATNMTSAGISHIVADPDQDIVYMVNEDGFYFEYNLNTSTLTELELDDLTSGESESSDDETSDTTNHTPTGIFFAESSSGDVILIPTNAGVIITIAPGSGSYSEVSLSSDAVDETANFVDADLSADENSLALVDSANDVLWIYSIRSEVFIDQDSSEPSSQDPISVSSSANSGFTNVTFFSESDGDEFIYASGADGLSLFDGNDLDEAPSDSRAMDADTSAGTSEDPISLSGTPGPLASSSAADGVLYSANGDATISVLTENPFVSVSTIDPATVNGTDTSFTATFQADVAGTYSVRVNSNPAGTTGTELLSGSTLATADTDESFTIDTADFDRSVFSEGSNRIVVFVTSSGSLSGRGAINLTVDRPPEASTITAVNFGNQKARITFNTSSDEDINKYTLLAEPAASQSSPSCPGSLTFTTSAATFVDISSDNCSGSSCTGAVTSLINGTTYCVALEVVDDSGQTSSLSTFSTAVTPQQTVGPAGFLGETGCSLHVRAQKNNTSLYGLVFFIFSLFGFKSSHQKKITKNATFLTALVFFLFIGLFQSPPLQAQEVTPQNWTFEVKGNMWIPTASSTKNFFGVCCQFGGEVEFGWIYKNQFNPTISAGFTTYSGDAIGITNGLVSGDKYRLWIFPIRLDFVYRFDLKSDQIIFTLCSSRTRRCHF